MATLAKLYNPGSLCFDKHGNLIVTDGGNYRIRKIDNTGIITTFAGNGSAASNGDGGYATAAACDPNNNMCVDIVGNIYYGDGISNTVRKIDTLGIISTIAGDSSGASTFVSDNILALGAPLSPRAVTFDPNGELVISDYHNSRVRKIDSLGIIHTIAGNGIFGYNGDNGPADSAEIKGTDGIVYDHCGNLYIAQINSPCIRKVIFDTPCHYIPTKINENETRGEVIVYPNPANSLLTIQSSNKISSILITNLHGQTLFCKSGIEEEKAEINIEYLPSGVYFVAVVDESGRKIIRKFIKE